MSNLCIGLLVLLEFQVELLGKQSPFSSLFSMLLRKQRKLNHNLRAGRGLVSETEGKVKLIRLVL